MRRSTGPGRDSGEIASRGGRANEAGSLHRSGIAAYLAAYGLAGRGLEAAGYPETGPAPVTLAFETGDAVDDIRCGLADGTTLWLQAKRACRADAQLVATVAQWTGQVPMLRPGDRIGLATAEPSRVVRDLGLALDRRRQLVAGIIPPGEKRAIEAVRSRMPAGVPALIAEQVLDAAIVMVVASSGPRDEGFRSVANLLDGTVVPAGSGSKAVRELQGAFQRQAAAGTGSGLDDWIRILGEADVDVFPDADGTAGQRRKAELDAIAAHRARLASRDGVLTFSLLAPGLLPVTYEPLADSFQVSVDAQDQTGKPFLIMGRRWPQMLLTGLPGMGKSTALEQAAARWAADSGAPIPVLVPLRDIATRNPRRGTDVTLPTLIEAATAGVPKRECVPLRRALESAAHSGEVILLLDGLDECEDRHGVVADGVAKVLSELPADTGVLLATRRSALTAARKLSLPVAELIAPKWLDSALSRLLRHAAVSAQIPDIEKDRWVRERVVQLDAIRSSHPDLWAVPLLATLLTLLVIQRPDASLPISRARLLLEAVQGTVEKWELTRLRETGHSPAIRGEQLNDGYGEIAHAVATGSGRCPVDGVRQKIAVMLADGWDLAPREAIAVAQEIMRFWDDHVGVFVASPGGEVTPRSRIFAEIGDAIWAIRQDSGTQREWIRDSLCDDNYREPVVLAASLSPGIACELIDAASRGTDPGRRSRALLWAADAAIEGAEPPGSSLNGLLSGLAQAARAAAEPEASDGESVGETALVRRPGWRYAVRIARLPLPRPMRAARNAALTGLASDEYERLLAGALATLTDAHTDSLGELRPEQAASVRNLLDMALPARERAASAPAQSPGTVKGFRRQPRLLSGHQQAAEQAAMYARQLGPAAVSAIYRIAHNGTISGYYRVSDRMTALGYSDPEPRRVPDMSGLFMRMGRLWDEWMVFLTAAASIAEPRPLALAERWRYPHLAALGDILEAGQTGLHAIEDALSADTMLLRGWIKAAARAVGLDLPAISAEAGVALQAWPAGNQDAADIMLAPPPPSSSPPAFRAARLGDDDIDVLIDALGATSEWLSGVACAILRTAGEPAIGRRAADRAPHIPVYLRGNAVIVAVANDRNPLAAAELLLDGDDPPSRAAAAAAALLLSGAADAESWKPVLDRAQTDDDMTVRLAAGTDEATAQEGKYWSCQSCGKINAAATRQCAACRDGWRLGVQIVTVSAQ
jgi:hypothetical protein